jgi:hypothetical protein
MHLGPAVSCVVSSDCDQRREIVSAHNPERAREQCEVLALRHISMDSLSPVGARPRLALFLVKVVLVQRVREFFGGIAALLLYGIVPALVLSVTRLK